MFTGIYRFVGLKDGKLSYYTFGLMQEVLLHLVPLCLIIVFNTENLQSEYNDLHYLLLVFSVLNSVELVLEWSYFKFYLDRGINLEQRLALPILHVIKDYI
jgi:hypothetical protein